MSDVRPLFRALRYEIECYCCSISNQWNVWRKTCVHKNTPLVLFNAKQQVLQFEK